MNPISDPLAGQQVGGYMQPPAPRHSRVRRVLGYCFALFTLEVGLFLLVFPWTDKWMFNYLQDFNPFLQDLWISPYFRGALSGLGIVNVYLAVLEFLRTQRLS